MSKKDRNSLNINLPEMKLGYYYKIRVNGINGYRVHINTGTVKYLFLSSLIINSINDRQRRTISGTI